MNTKEVETKKVVKIMNETVSIKDSINFSRIYIRIGKRSFKALFGLMVVEALVAAIAGISGFFVPPWVAFIIAVAVPIVVTAIFHRKIEIEVHHISKG